MEIEAKFRVPNREAHRNLLRLRSVAGYDIVRTGRIDVVDRYYDTADGRLLGAGFSCRLRMQSGRVLATLKGLGSAPDAEAAAAGGALPAPYTAGTSTRLRWRPWSWTPATGRQATRAGWRSTSPGAPLSNRSST